MSGAPTRMNTRAGNATAHPGLVVAPLKRTRDDGKTKKEIAKERKQAKEEKQKAIVHKVASLEKRIAEDQDAANITPKPQGTNSRQLRRTLSYAQIPLTKETVPDSDNSASDDVGEGMHDGDTEPNTTDQEAPPKKKSKQKPSFRDAVQRYLDEDGNLKSEYVRPRTDHQYTDDMEIVESGSDGDDLYDVSRQNIFETRQQLTQLS